MDRKVSAAFALCAAAIFPLHGLVAKDATPDRAMVLSSTQAPESAWQTSIFAPPVEALPPSHRIEGELSIDGEQADKFTLLRDSYDYRTSVPQTRNLPRASVTLVSQGNEVIPVERGPILRGDPAWDWIFEPGRAWDNPANPGMTFVALPFALMQRNSNCLHNGLALWAIDTAGTATSLAYQIGSETCEYFQFDMWGLAEAKFKSAPVAARTEAIAAYDREVATRLPVRPIGELGDAAKGFGSPEEVKPAALTTFGFVDDRTLYAGPCPTRYGPYPYCDVLDIPSYSWAKSIAAAIGLMRLEQLYPGAKDAVVADLVPECADAGWNEVTLENLLDMTSGHYDSPKQEVDEDSQSMSDFIVTESHADRAGMACHLYPRKEAPGQRSVYHSSDTYLLGTAMNAYLRARGKAGPDYYRDLVVPVLEELGVSPLLLETRRTIDDARQPFTGWGLILHRNDAALLARLYQRGGKIDGKQVLDATMVAQAMQRDPHSPGLPIYDSKNWRYQHSLWVRNVASLIGCTHDVWVPFFSGHGGLSNVMFPNGNVYFRIGDGFDYDWSPSAIAANQIKSLCN